jgi:hypothetical protein
VQAELGKIKLNTASPSPLPTLVGPEISGACTHPSSQFDYLSYFLNKSNHVGGYTPPLGSYHGGVHGHNATAEGFYTSWDAVLEGFVEAVGDCVWLM